MAVKLRVKMDIGFPFPVGIRRYAAGTSRDHAVTLTTPSIDRSFN